MKSVYFNNNFERGFGTFPLKDTDCERAVKTAYEAGYRAFDTAQMYGNEAATGKALNAISGDRDELFITTKVNNGNYAASDFLTSVEQSLRYLQTDYIDVLLLHWPPADFNIEPPLHLLAEAREKNYTRHIGVSNFTSQMMRDAQSIIDVPIVINQVEFHPLLNQDILLATASDTGIPLSAYCAVARGEIFKYPVLGSIGERHGKSAAQVAQRWTLQKGVSVNTMSTSAKNIQANFDIDDFELSSGDMAAIDQLNQENYRIVDKSLVPWAPEFD